MKSASTGSRLKAALVALACLLWLVGGCDKPAEPATRAAPASATSAPVGAAVVVEAFPAGFTSASAQVNGTTLHYVVGGQGPALILIHGFPENWSAFATIMSGLASKFRVVAVDLRGIGGSTPVHGDHETATMAEDVHQLALKLGLDRPYVVGHDIGGGVAYAIAPLYPDAVRGAMILDVPIPGVDPWDQSIRRCGISAFTARRASLKNCSQGAKLFTSAISCATRSPIPSRSATRRYRATRALIRNLVRWPRL